jgi:hypothetical protein
MGLNNKKAKELKESHLHNTKHQLLRFRCYRTKRSFLQKNDSGVFFAEQEVK